MHRETDRQTDSVIVVVLDPSSNYVGEEMSKFVLFISEAP